VPGQPDEGLFGFSFIKQPVLLALGAFNVQVPLGEQDLFSGHRPAAFGPQGEPVPFDKTEWAATAQAANITRTNNAVFRLFQAPEPDEQQSPFKPDVSLQFSFCCSLSSFVSMFFPQK